MAPSNDRDGFADETYRRFSERLRRNLDALRLVLARPAFGDGPATFGAELEFSLIGEQGRASPVNRALLAHESDPRLSLELDRFNVEYDLGTIPGEGSPFATLESRIGAALEHLDESAARFDARPVTIGILPTLSVDELQSAALTDLPRYRALSSGMRRLRGAPFTIRISGEETLELSSEDIALEGASTSFQLQLRVEPARFADTYNAAQLATPIALAVAANSPVFLGRRLWDETRVALFKQSLDDRAFDPAHWHPPSRVSFGHGWVRTGAAELFEESVVLHPPLFPLVGGEDALAVARTGGVPRLDELRLHQRTVWRWNRAVYDPDHGGHLCIEMRALPSGPTAIDMAANAAFLLGLTMGLRDEAERLVIAMPFRSAEYDFYRAAQHGLDAEIAWPCGHSCAPAPRPVADVARELLPVAERGLAALGVDACESARMLGVIRDRLDAGLTGARWQRRALDHLPASLPRDEALARMLEAYVARARSGRAVHEWSEII